MFTWGFTPEGALDHSSANSYGPENVPTSLENNSGACVVPIKAFISSLLFSFFLKGSNSSHVLAREKSEREDKKLLAHKILYEAIPWNIIWATSTIIHPKVSKKYTDREHTFTALHWPESSRYPSGCTVNDHKGHHHLENQRKKKSAAVGLCEEPWLTAAGTKWPRGKLGAVGSRTPN